MSSIVDISEVMLSLGLSASAQPEERAIALLCITSAEGAIKRHLKYDPVYGQRTEYYPLQDVSMGSRLSVWEVTDTQAYERHISSAASDTLQIKHVPIRSVTSLRVDYDGRSGTQAGSFGSDTAKTEGTDFWPNYDGVDSDGNRVCRDGILRSIGAWPTQVGSVKIVYYSGYRGAELRGQDTVIDASPIWDACLDEVTRRFLKVMSRKKNPMAGFVGPLNGERLGDCSYTANTAILQRLLGGADLMLETQDKLSSFVNYGSLLI